MDKLRLMTIVGTRPEIIRLSETIKKCDHYFDHIFVHTGQNYDYTLSQIFFEELGLRQPDHYLDAVGEDLGDTIGNIIARSYRLLRETSPDALLILGDTNSALSALSAKRLKIPVFHMEAGNRCFDENLPEEINRRIVDHIADVNLCYSEHARRYLSAEGVAKERTFVVGSPMAEVLSRNRAAIEQSTALDKLGVEAGGYILLSAHREENVDIEGNFFTLMSAVNEMARHFRMPVIYSVHPRSAKRIAGEKFVFDPNVRAMEPFGFLDYNQLQRNAYCVISDSGTLPEEASYWGFPGVCIRTSTERPEALDKGNFILAGIKAKEIIRSVSMAVEMHRSGDSGSPVADYREENVSLKVVKLIAGYTEIVNATVWRKPPETTGGAR